MTDSIARPLRLFGWLLAASPAAAQSVLYEYSGTATEVSIGDWSVAGLDDVDHDGTRDFAFTLIDASGALPYDAIRVCSGATGVPIYTVVSLEAQTWGFHQVRLESCGDFDSDGTSDFAMGAPSDNQALAYSGATGTLLFQAVGPGGPAFGSTFGWDLNGAGDVDADGVPDLIVGRRFPATGQQFEARVFSGATGALMLALPGQQNLDEFGYSVDGATDLNGDGHDDVVVSAPTYDNGLLVNAGALFFRSGADGSPLGHFAAFTGGVELGHHVRRIGDATGDGIADFAASSLALGGFKHRIRVISGSNFVQTAQVDGFEYNGDVDLAAAGDLDGDGRGDVVVGAIGDQLPWQGEYGAVRMLSGADLHLLDVLTGTTALTGFGRTVDSLGDLNQDGTLEFVVGVPPKVQVLSTCVPTTTPYGAGCSPTGGAIPQLSVTGCAEAGGNLIVLSDAIPSPVIFFVSFGAANLTLPGGCKFLVDPVGSAFFASTLVVGGQSGFPAIVPSAAAGLTLKMQAIGKLASGFAIATNGVSVPIQ